MATSETDVWPFLDLLEQLDAHPIVIGGWGVDALVGRASRIHRDLDVLVRASLVDAVVGRLHELGYWSATDWLPARLELTAFDRRIDLHPSHDDGDGGWWQHGLDGARFEYPASVLTTGRIGGRCVRCLTAAKQVELHTGYALRAEDEHDLALLRSMPA